MLQSFCNGVLQASELGEGTEAAVAGITGIGFAIKVIAHLMAVVRAQEDAEAAFLLHFQYGLHHLVNGHVAFQQVGLVEVALLVPFGEPYRSVCIQSVSFQESQLYK